MKKLITLFFALSILASCSDVAYGQIFIKKGHHLVRSTRNAKSIAPNVSISIDTAISYDQLNIQASYVPVQYSQGGFHEIEGTTLGFTLSKMWYKAQATITVTADRDTIFSMSSKGGIGTGVTVMNNFKTGKVGIGPSIVFAADKFSGIAGVAFEDASGLNIFFKSAIPYLGLSTTIDNLRGFINNSTKIKTQ